MDPEVGHLPKSGHTDPDSNFPDMYGQGCLGLDP